MIESKSDNTGGGVAVKLSPEQQRIAIAEACGWHCCGPYRVGRTGNQRTVFKGVHPFTSMQGELPDYLNDLNAMHEAEKTIPDYWGGVPYKGSKAEYFDQLFSLFNAPPLWQVFTATAAQRAEAFLRTIGKWPTSR